MKDFAVNFLGIGQCECKQKWKNSRDEWINTVWETHNGILVSLKKEGNSDTYNTGDSLRHCVKWNKLVAKGQALYNSTLEC